MRSRRWRWEEEAEIDWAMSLDLVRRYLLREEAEKALCWDDWVPRFCGLEKMPSCAMCRARFWRPPEVAVDNGIGAIL